MAQARGVTTDGRLVRVAGRWWHTDQVGQASLAGGEVRLLEAEGLRLCEVPAPVPSPRERVARDRAWDEAVRANPALFDGPVAVCAGVSWGPGRQLVLAWARATYRNFALRMVAGATSWLPSLFVAVVQPTDDGRLLVGRMGGSTAAPGRWQLPGGTVDPPGEGRSLDVDALGRHAVLELAEEVGVQAVPAALSVWSVVQCGNGNVGVLFCAPPVPAPVVRERFQGLRRSENGQGRETELVEIAFVGQEGDLSGVEPLVDYLRPAVRLFAQRDAAAGHGVWSVAQK